MTFKTNRRGFLKVMGFVALGYLFQPLLSEAIRFPVDEAKAWELVGYDNYPGIAGRYEDYQTRP